MNGGTTGVSAVNAEGEILVFCDAGYCDLECFTIEGREMRFYAAETGEVHFSAVFGRLTVETASVRGDVVVCFAGTPVKYLRVPARYGL